MTNDYPGIDYGLGQTNIDHVTGIRYGIIPLLDTECLDDAESYYTASCPHCGHDLEGIAEETYFDYAEHLARCPSCHKAFDPDERWSDEPAYSRLNIDDIEASIDSDSDDVWVTKSPYYTRAQFCSPCAPGAAYLLKPVANGPKAYCLPADCFAEGRCPYPIYRVEDDVCIYEPVAPSVEDYDGDWPPGAPVYR